MVSIDAWKSGTDYQILSYPSERLPSAKETANLLSMKNISKA